MKQIIVLVFILAGMICPAISQTEIAPSGEIEYIDVLYMKDGSEFRGSILALNGSESVEFKLLGGQEITFLRQRIKKIVQERVDCEPFAVKKLKKEYNFREKGIYNVTAVSTFNGTNRWGDVIVGLGISHVTGYQFNRYAGVGIGAGFDNYSMGEALMAVPVFAEVRGYFLRSNTTPYYSVRSGISMPLKKDEFDIIGGTPGLLFYPSAGYRIGAGQASFIVDIGYKIQKLTYEYRSTWELERLEHHTFRRVALRVGVLF